jgi:hypothetical protein
MRIAVALSLVVFLSFFGCKNSKKSTESKLPEISKKEVVESEVVQAEEEEMDASAELSAEEMAKKQAEIKRHQPYIKASMFFGMYRSPCFGQCPVYNLDIDTAGHAVIEAKRFFDFQGFHEANLTPTQMQLIVDKANDAGYFALEHVYDANVTDLPSTLTILQTSSELQWVYNRLNAPEGLGRFEASMDSLIRTLDWKPFDPKK